MFLNRKNEEKHIAHDFTMRAPFASYRPVDYRGFEPFLRFKPEIDGYLAKLFAEEAVDEGEKDVLDALVHDVTAKAEQDLDHQKIEHIDKIHSFYNRRVGDKRAFERELEVLNTALAENEKELEAIEERHNVNKF